MPDVRLYDTPDGGEIDYVNGVAQTDQGLETAAYLSLYGGNDDDRALQADDPIQWWGNIIEEDENATYRSRFQALVQGLPATSANLKRLQQAAETDLGWMASADIADAVRVAVAITGLNRVQVDVEIDVGSQTYDFTFTFRRSAE